MGRQRKRRSRGSGSIFRNASGYYCYQWVDATGKKRTKSLRTKNYKQACEDATDFDSIVHEQSKELLAEQTRISRGYIKRRDLPLADVWSQFLKTQPTCTPGTLANHKCHLDAFIEWLLAKHIRLQSFAAIEDDVAIEYADYLWEERKLSAATYNYHRASLMVITSKLAHKFGIQANPWKQVERKKGAQQQRRKLTDDQLTKLLLSFDDPTCTISEKDETRVLFKIGAYTGLRLKDAALLQWSSVDLQRNRIECMPYKTRRVEKRVVIPILPPLREELLFMQSRAVDQYVLPHMAESYRTTADGPKKKVVEIIRSVCQPNGDGEARRDAAEQETDRPQCLRRLGEYGFHSLRHTFISQCANGGVPMLQLALMTGDSIKTLERYYIEAELDPEPMMLAYRDVLQIPDGSAPAAGNGSKTTDPQTELHRIVDAMTRDEAQHWLTAIRAARRDRRALAAADDQA